MCVKYIDSLKLLFLKEKILFFSEYAKHPEIDENVAVIVCGKETKFLRYFSNHYEDTKYCIGKSSIPCYLAVYPFTS